jgi:hypothetical protein
MPTSASILLDASTKVADAFVGIGFRLKHPPILLTVLAVGVPVVLAIFLLGILVSYVVIALLFWSLCRMSAAMDRHVESRANVVPFKRG